MKHLCLALVLFSALLRVSVSVALAYDPYDDEFQGGFVSAEAGVFYLLGAPRDQLDDPIMVYANLGFSFADAFSTKSVFSILQTTAILDTVIFSAGTDIDGYFLKAFVKDHKSKNVFAQFYCSKNVYDEYIASQTTHFLTAVRIKEYNECQTYIDLETIDNELLTLPGKRKIILTGECLEIIETGRG